MPIEHDEQGVRLAPDWSHAAYEAMASELSEATGLDITAIDPGDPAGSGYSGFRVKETATHFVDVCRMLVNWRVVVVPKGRLMPVPERYWCYAGTGTGTLIAAVAAVHLWDVSAGTEPAAFVKRGQPAPGELRARGGKRPRDTPGRQAPGRGNPHRGHGEERP